MHIVIMTRGAIQSVKRFIDELSNQYLPFKMKGQNTRLQVRVSPIQLWDISFPKECEEAMKNHLFSNGDVTSMTPRNNKFVAVIRKMMGLKKMKNFKPKGNMLGISKPQHMDIFAIGKKADGVMKDPLGDYEAI